MANTKQRFRGVLERGDKSLGWTILRVPFDPQQVWPRLIRLRVCGELTGTLGSAPFRTSLFPVPGGGGYFLLVNRRVQTDTGAALGDMVTCQLEPDLAERPAELPEELDALLDEAEGLRAWYEALTEYTRREIGKWIQGVKGPEARMRRAGQMAERMLSTVEAEQELPPAVERALRLHPKAREGWARMSPTQRRMELFAVFYYQTPAARERRIARLIETAEKRAAKA